MTEKESLLAQQRELFTIEKLLTQQSLTLEELDEILPALFHVNSPEDSSLVFVSEKGCDFLQIDKEELMPYSAEQLAEIVTADTLQNITPPLCGVLPGRG